MQTTTARSVGKEEQRQEQAIQPKALCSLRTTSPKPRQW